MTSATHIRSRWIWLGLILILAAGLRFYRLDAQSFWNDEGNSARITERSFEKITEAAAGDIHPPLYYYALATWRGLFGASELALRSLSAVLGVLLVWLVYRIGQRTFGMATGLIAAFLAAINPFQVYYSQEARMYMLLAVIGAAATSVLLSLLVEWSDSHEVKARRLTLSIEQCALCILYAAGLYTHYAFPFIIATHFLIVLAWAVATRRSLVQQLLPWMGLAAVSAVLFGPWLPTAIRQITTWPSSRATIDAGAMLLDTFRLYVLGPTFPTADALAPILIAGFFLIVSLWNPHFDERRVEATQPLSHALRSGAIVLWWLVPIALIFGFGLFKESYLKFLLIGSAAFCLLLARGIVTAFSIGRGALRMPRELAGQPMAAWSWTLVIVFLLAWLAVPTVTALNNYYFDPKYARDDYRSIARDIVQNPRPGDAVILDSANQWEVFTYYYPDGPNVFPLPRHRPIDPLAIAAELSDIVAKYSRLFVLYWGDTEADPQHVIESWLDAHTYKAAEHWVGAVRFVTYAVPMQLSSTPATVSGARFGDHITLDGYTLATQQLAPGDILQLDLFWRTDAQLAERYKVFVHVVGADGAIAAQTDREPGGGRNPTTNWGINELIVDRYGVLIPDNVVEGRYSVEIGLYDFSGTRLKMADGRDALIVAQVDVKSPTGMLRNEK